MSGMGEWSSSNAHAASCFLSVLKLKIRQIISFNQFSLRLQQLIPFYRRTGMPTLQPQDISQPSHTSGIHASFNKAMQAQRRVWRLVKDVTARWAVTIGGMFSILAIFLIFIYLFQVVLPLFEPARMELAASYAVPGAEPGKTLYVAVEEQRKVGCRFTNAGHAVFFSISSGAVIKDIALPIPSDVRVTVLAPALDKTATLALGLSNGKAIVVKHTYNSLYSEGGNTIEPEVKFPFGETPLDLIADGASIEAMAFQVHEDNAVFVVKAADRPLSLVSLARKTSFLGDSTETELERVNVPEVDMSLNFMLISSDMKTLYLADKTGRLLRFDISNTARPVLLEKTQILPSSVSLVDLRFLGGGFSLVAADSQGRVTQWFPVRKGEAQVLQRIREFGPYKGIPTLLLSEFNRRGFAILGNDGIFSLHYATSHRTLLKNDINVKSVVAAAFAPRNNGVLLATHDRIYFWRVSNHHPEVSWSSLWGKVWYEYYDAPTYTWQSSSASDDFEPKFSLVPVTFGTFKAAFYAMFFAVPLAILGAMYTANFMSYRMMALVKPAVEIMGAMPTVILGFLAGIWFAPFAETHIPSIFCLLLLLMPAMFLASGLWERLPETWRRRVPPGWEALLLLPVVILTGFLAFYLGEFIDDIWMNGDCRHWLSHELGIGFDQRNALIVGVAMGFAVIPPIFTITEDAIYGVPKHLIQGSLALGATPWQTMMRVVLPTASPAIFSAVMMGLGRAIGETMIVLMATGNTPVMDFSIFQGLRTLSANIAVEMPEAEVGSTHFRVLFLSGLTLFALTFFFNTLAEMVRHRLRRKYSSL